MNEHDNPGKLADELEREADELHERGERVQEAVEDTRSEWQARKADPTVPGAVPDDEQHDPPGDEDPASFPSKRE